MKLEEFNNLDPNNFGNWPIPVKGVIILIICIAVSAAAFYLDTQPQLVSLGSVERKEESLKADFKKKQWKAATLPKLKEQLAEIEKSLGELQRRLPNKAEVAGLIQDISQAAIASGLRSELFKPGDERSDKDVYVKLPITLTLSGNYHAFGKFVSSVAAMPRIVTQHNIEITTNTGQGRKKPRGGKNEGGNLTMKMTAQIYRYLEVDEVEGSNLSKSKKGKNGLPKKGKKK